MTIFSEAFNEKWHLLKLLQFDTHKTYPFCVLTQYFLTTLLCNCFSSVCFPYNLEDEHSITTPSLLPKKQAKYTSIFEDFAVWLMAFYTCFICILKKISHPRLGSLVLRMNAELETQIFEIPTLCCCSNRFVCPAHFNSNGNKIDYPCNDPSIYVYL